uniref:Uncharacterized protein n=1 Tax=Ornithorhynchus anatinus TaxID=9258 RepID=A0A6I8PMF0_ORNAN
IIGSLAGSWQVLDLLQTLLRISLTNPMPTLESKRMDRRQRGRRRGRLCGKGYKVQRHRGNRSCLGFERGYTLLFLHLPIYVFSDSFWCQHVPLGLRGLQYLMDLVQVHPTHSVDLTQIHLVEEGVGTFDAKVNVEVQLDSELASVAIEKNGNTITNSFYDLISVVILSFHSFIHSIIFNECLLRVEH